jgi:hypothetical protein
MDNYLQTLYNRYIRYLNNLNYGNTEQDYTFLYAMFLYYKFEIDRVDILQFIYNNLK